MQSKSTFLLESHLSQSLNHFSFSREKKRRKTEKGVIRAGNVIYVSLYLHNGRHKNLPSAKSDRTPLRAYHF